MEVAQIAPLLGMGIFLLTSVVLGIKLFVSQADLGIEREAYVELTAANASLTKKLDKMTPDASEGARVRLQRERALVKAGEANAAKAAGKAAAKQAESALAVAASKVTKPAPPKSRTSRAKA